MLCGVIVMVFILYECFVYVFLYCLCCRVEEGFEWNLLILRGGLFSGFRVLLLCGGGGLG